jgi:serine phosphatase RsbU (regulator of sigma subunit)/pSer/pThr/pTyr-binding forkhead associated (FHA) protein
VAHLVFVAGPNAGRRYKLGDGEYVIGRRSDCQIFVPDMRVSRQHARLLKQSGSWQLEDLGSNNGTFVNGARIQQHATIRHDDEIQIASNRIRVELPEAQVGERPVESNVTIVEVHNSAVWTAQPDSSPLSLSMQPRSGSHPSLSTEMRAIRLIERKVEALTSILEITAHSTDPDQLVERMVDALLVLYPQADSVGVLVEDERSGELKVQCQRHRQKSFGGDMRVPGTIISHVVADRRGVLLGDAAAPAPDGEPIGNRMGAPLVYQGSHYGVVYVESTEGQDFRQEDVDLLGSIAAQVGLAIHAVRVQAQLARRERLERDLRVARQIQRSLLPAQAPTVVGLEFAIHYEPAYQIGGDFYDFIWHDQSHLALAVGDVAGKAISAALYMARLTSELRSRAGIARTPARLLRRVNAEMVKLGDDGMFATLVYCIYDLETRSLIFTNAGHCVPLLRRGDRVFPLHADRAHIAPIGVMPELEAGEARVQLHSGDMLILVSDGIIEARDARGFEYGLNRLSRRVRTARGNAEDVVKAILLDIDGHTSAGPQGDDMTIVAMAIEERRAKRKTTTLPGVTPGDADKATNTGSGVPPSEDDVDDTRV